MSPSSHTHFRPGADVQQVTYHNKREPGLGNTGTAVGTAVQEVDALSALGQLGVLSRGGKSALGDESRGGEGLEGNHCVCCWGERRMEVSMC